MQTTQVALEGVDWMEGGPGMGSEGGSRIDVSGVTATTSPPPSASR